MNYFSHNLSDVQSNKIGNRTKIWQYVIILADAEIGEDCNICSHCFIENNVTIGNRVTIKSSVQIWNGMTIGNDVFIGPNVTFTNDKYPISQNRKFNLLSTIIEDGVSIGGGATILPGIRIGKSSIIGAGTVVTKDIPSGVIVVGNPGKILTKENYYGQE